MSISYIGPYGVIFLKFEDYKWELESIYCYLHGAGGTHQTTNHETETSWYSIHWFYTHKHQDLVITECFRHFYEVPDDLPLGACVGSNSIREVETVRDFVITDESFEQLRQEVVKKFLAERLKSLFEGGIS
jgi:hypothetical protein